MRSREIAEGTGMIYCPACNQLKPKGDFRAPCQSRKTISAYCIECQRIKVHEWYLKHKKEKIIQAKGWRQSNPEKSRGVAVRCAKKRRSSLTDVYIKTLLRAQKSEITSELIDLTRQRIIAKRVSVQERKEKKAVRRAQREAEPKIPREEKHGKQKAAQRAKYRLAYPRAALIIPETRICSKCGTKKPLTLEFFARFNRKRVPSFRNDCLTCQKEWRRPWEHERYKTNLKHKLNRRLGNAIRWNLSGGKGRRPWLDLVDWTIDNLIRHLEKQFQPGMSWGNYGNSWHIDHKIPISAFNFNTPDDLDFKKCWALKNLQPLPALENIIKRDRLQKPFQPSLAISAGGL